MQQHIQVFCFKQSIRGQQHGLNAASAPPLPFSCALPSRPTTYPAPLRPPPAPRYRNLHKHLDLKAVKRMARQILKGLEYLHSMSPPVVRAREAQHWAQHCACMVHRA